MPPCMVTRLAAHSWHFYGPLTSKESSKPLYGKICALKRHLCQAAGVKRKTAHSLMCLVSFQCWGRRKADTRENRSSLECLFEYEKPTEENVANVSAVLGPSASVLNIN